MDSHQLDQLDQLEESSETDSFELISLRTGLHGDSLSETQIFQNKLKKLFINYLLDINIICTDSGFRILSSIFYYNLPNYLKNSSDYRYRFNTNRFYTGYFTYDDSDLKYF